MTAEGPENLTKGTVRGLSWTYASNGSSAIMQTVYTAVIARLLAPEDFGLLAMAMVFQRFGSYFARMGVAQALIQKPELDERDVRVAFTSTVMLGLVFGAGVVAAAPLAGAVFDTADVVPVVRVLALAFILDSLGQVSVSLLQRELRFRELAIIDMVTFAVAYFAIGITMAAAGFGVWSLVAVQLAHAGLRSAAWYAGARHRLTPQAHLPTARRLFAYGSRISVISFLEFIGSSLDTFVIGRTAGQAQLGQYNRAYLLVTLPFQNIVTGFSGVLFPSLSHIQADRRRLGEVYRSSIAGIAAVILPIAAGLAVASSEVVRVAIGSQWAGAAAVLPFLAFSGALNFLSVLGGVVCDATATLNRKLVLQSVHVVLLGGLLAYATTFDGLRPFAIALLVAEAIRHLLYIRLVSRIIGFGLRDHLRAYAGPVVTALVVAVAMALFTAALGPVAPVLVTFLGQLLVGALVLAAALTYGPLASIRHDARDRFRRSGLLDGEGRSTRTIAWLLDFGR